MLRNHLIIALRSALKQKGYTAINIIGLVLGLATFFIIALYVHDELSYDKFLEDSDQIYRVAYDKHMEASTKYENTVPGALKGAILSEVPEVLEVTALMPSYWGSASLRNGQYTYYDRNFLYVDSVFLKVFSFTVLQGDGQTALMDPASVVLTESTAKKFFAAEGAIGQILRFQGGVDLKVTAVIADIPPQSHIQFDFLLPMANASRTKWESSWGEGHFLTYLKIQPDASITSVEEKLQHLADIHQKEYRETHNLQEKYYAEPLVDLHFQSHGYQFASSGDYLKLETLSAIAIFLLVIAGINYVNLATARSSLRAKDIGLRKTLGVNRSTLIMQFLTESMITVFIAAVLSICLIQIVLPYFSAFAGKALSLPDAGSRPVWGLFIGIIIFFGLAAGMYPASYLSAPKPAVILRNMARSTKGRVEFRKGLVVFQFSLSTFLLIGMLVVKQQINFIQSMDLGFDKDQVLVIRNFSSVPQWGDPDYVVRRAIENLPGVQRVGGNLENMIGTRGGATGSMRLNASTEPVASMAQLVDNGYIDVFGLQFVAGRNFSPELDVVNQYGMSDTRILNETAVKQLGIVGSPIGQMFGNNEIIVGVVKDFHVSNLHHEIMPYVFIYTPKALEVAIKLTRGNIRQTVSEIEQVWKSFVPEVPMDYYFVDEAIDRQYRAEQRFDVLLTILTVLVVLVACMGLFGLAAFATEVRGPEIGIRKVFGASVRRIASLLSWDFVKLVVLANLIAFPLAWIVAKQWLATFAYRTSMGVGLWLTTLLLSLLITLCAVGWQTVRASLINPVDAIRNDL